MPCFTPLEASRRIDSGEKPTVWKRGQRPKQLADGYEALALPCRHCIGCKLEFSRVWGARCAQEAAMYERQGRYSSFLTLTYRSEGQATDRQMAEGYYLPRDLSLNKKHHKDFMKRLRDYLDGLRVSYYHCGEYGDQTDRPHYHTLLFGYTFPDQKFFKDSNGYPLFTSQILDDLWKFGHCYVGAVTFESACYVARYALKKITGKKAHEHYRRFDENGVAYWLQPEYSTQSTRPALGKGWYEEYKDRMYEEDSLAIPGRGTYGKPPRYYDKLLEVDDPQLLEQVKEKREEFWMEHPEESTPARLWAREQVQMARKSMLARSHL